ncbi:MAG: transcriptional regulator NrdR [Planctomycetota bacterium]|nr:transcriptional regulator NrdR [Planctomycetota bacterium]
MRCPFCDSDRIKVVDSRPSDDGTTIRRRRECESEHCGKRFTTYERVEQARRLVVVKRDESRVPFDAEKVRRGLQAACGKRPISEEVKEELVRLLEDQLQREFDREVPTAEIGRRVSAALRSIDAVAYIRFASEQEQFGSADDFAVLLDELKRKPPPPPNQTALFGD